MFAVDTEHVRREADASYLIVEGGARRVRGHRHASVRAEFAGCADRSRHRRRASRLRPARRMCIWTMRAGPAHSWPRSRARVSSCTRAERRTSPIPPGSWPRPERCTETRSSPRSSATAAPIPARTRHDGRGRRAARARRAHPRVSAYARPCPASSLHSRSRHAGAVHRRHLRHQLSRVRHGRRAVHFSHHDTAAVRSRPAARLGFAHRLARAALRVPDALRPRRRGRQARAGSRGRDRRLCTHCASGRRRARSRAAHRARVVRASVPATSGARLPRAKARRSIDLLDGDVALNASGLDAWLRRAGLSRVLGTARPRRRDYLGRSRGSGLRGVRTLRAAPRPRHRHSPRRPSYPTTSVPRSWSLLRYRVQGRSGSARPRSCVFHQERTAGAARTSDGDCFRPKCVGLVSGPCADGLFAVLRSRSPADRSRRRSRLPAAEAPRSVRGGVRRLAARRGGSGARPDACEGRRQDIAFSAHRTEGPESRAATVSITLVAVSAP